MTIEQDFQNILDKYLEAERLQHRLMDIDQWRIVAEHSGLPVRKFFDTISVLLTRKFIAGELPFEFCRWIITDLEKAATRGILDKWLDEFGIFDSVYVAFNAEDFFALTADPIEKYVRPMLVEILEEQAKQ